jgi:hypothetical protein
MTRRQHIFAIQNIINRGAPTDDNRFSSRLIGFYLDVERGLLLKRKLDKYQHISEENFQTICMPLELTSFHDCDCIPNQNCYILRSKYKLPKRINAKWGSTLIVKLFDSSPIGETTVAALSNNQYSRIPESKNPLDNLRFFIFNRYLYIVGSTKLKGVLVFGLFENPSQVENYNICDSDGVETSDPCYSVETDEYPIDIDLVSPLHDMVLRKMGVMQKFPEDNENNARMVQVSRDIE